MKIIKYIQIGLFLLFCLIAKNIQAQERLIGLQENPLVPEQSKQKRSILKSTPLSLPFFDDFAKPTNYLPDSEKWVNNYVFINNSYAINPPTIGVATFDAFDNTGKLYPAAGPILFAADTLTSQTINLALLPSDSVYLSFYYQPAGHGDMPEPDDSLTLEFKTNTGEWVNVWSASVNLTDSTLTLVQYGERLTIKAKDLNPFDTILGTAFYKAHFKIDDVNYLHSTFQFRFINYASIGVNSNIQGRSTSTDHWHLDYVYLDRDRSILNLNLPDVALVTPQKPLTDIFESIPATHLSTIEASDELFPDPMRWTWVYRNLGWGTQSVTRMFSITPLYGTGSSVQTNANSENIFDYQTVTFDNYFANKYNFTTTDDSAAFEIKTYLITDNNPSALRTEMRYNDTTRYTQYYRDYYAYDDGTAENGYGLFGNNTANGKVAVQYQSYKNDSIRGVYMYFNRAINNANAVSFYVTVWSDFNGAPDTIMYTGKVNRPVFKDSLNKYVAYKFDKPVYIEKGTNYYVGWTQVSDNFLNIGFDRNRNHQDKTFYNIYGTWESTAYEGSLMIRPIFTRTANEFPDDYEETKPPVIEGSSTSSYIAYPNPVVNGLLRIAKNDEIHTPIQSYQIDVYDTMGRLLLKQVSDNGEVNLSTLPGGIYIIRIWENGESKGVKRIIIAK